MNQPSYRGFTLLELLVVIAIIGILAGLVIGLIGPLRLRAKLADTQVKMNSVQQGMSLIGQSEGSATYKLQQLTEYRPSGSPTDIEPGLGGIMTFGAPDTEYPGVPSIARRPPLLVTDQDAPWGLRGRGHLAYPWGKKFPPINGGGAGGAVTMMGPERFLLRHMSPFNTRKLMKIANILPTKNTDLEWWQKEYMTNRKPSEGWNDAWGHPIVVAATLYQPTFKNATPAPSVPGWKDGAWPAVTNPTAAVDPNTTPVSSSTYIPSSAPYSSTPPNTTPKPVPADCARKALLEHLKLYQYNRSVYIAVAAVGPHAWVDDVKLKSGTVSDWANSAVNPTEGTLDELWAQANWVCQQAKIREFDKDWSELSFDNPMWQGNKYDYLNKAKHAADMNKDYYTDKYKGHEEHCLLSAPQEYK